MKRSLKGDITMLFYTATIVFSLLTAIPIIILIYQTDSLANKAVADSIFDDRATTTGSTSAKKFRVKPVKLDDAKSIIRRKQLNNAPDHDEKPATVDTPLKVVANEVPQLVTEAPKSDTEVPNIVSEVPKIAAEAPRSVTEVSKFVAEAPQSVPEVPNIVTEAPKFVNEAPKFVVEAPQSVTKVPNIVTEPPKFLTEVPKFAAQAPQSVNEAPKFAAEAPQSVNEVPKIVTDVPEIMSLETVFKPFNGKISANTF